MTSGNQFFKNNPPQNPIQAKYVLTGRYVYDGSFFNPCTWQGGQVLGGINCAGVNPLYIYSGDAVTQKGWINTVPNDQRNILNTGPFKLEKNKPVDIIIANIVGRGSDYLNSITIAKNYAANIIKYYNLNFPNSILTGVRDIPQVINSFNLSQNYPNPFNPSTTISFNIVKQEHVSLKVYNILGEVVSTLVNEEKGPGNYSIRFETHNLSSGIYFYEINTGNFREVKKMVILK
jgi:hypothetical protein